MHIHCIKQIGIGRVVKMAVGQEQTIQRLFRAQALAEFPDVSGAHAAIDEDQLLVALHQVAVVAVAEYLPYAVGQLLLLEVGHTHGADIALLVLDQNIIQAGPIQRLHILFPMHCCVLLSVRSIAAAIAQAAEQQSQNQDNSLCDVD